MGTQPIIDTTLVHEGVPGLALTGDRIRATVFPAAGGKIADLVHVPSGFDLLWRNPRVPLRATYPGASFDDVWSGGWDELFPTDPPCVVGDNAFHDHGDLWCGPWECGSSPTTAIPPPCTCGATPCRCRAGSRRRSRSGGTRST
jgi:hypothetical protein